MLADRLRSRPRRSSARWRRRCECEIDGNVPITPHRCGRNASTPSRSGRNYRSRKRLAGIARCGSSLSAWAFRGESAARLPAPNSSPTVDPVNPEADYRSIADVPLDAYDAALACIPDEPKIELLTYLLGNGKHVLVEKPLLGRRDEDAIARRSQATGAAQRRRLLHRLQPPLRAAFRAHARGDRVGRARPHLFTAGCSTATARRGWCATRPGATRAPACCPTSARICSTPASSGSARIDRPISGVVVGRPFREPRARSSW